MADESFLSKFPRQKLSMTQKGKSWRKKCVDAVDTQDFLWSEEVRAKVETRKINQDLMNGILHKRDIESTCNSAKFDISGIEWTDIQHYPIMNTRIELLIGEEAKRRFDFKAIVTNPEAITQKENEKRKIIEKKVNELIDSDLPQEEVQKEMESLQEFLEYDFQDMHERRANMILRHYWEQERMQEKFNSGFRDALIYGEEYYQCEIVSGEPVVRKLDPLHVFSYMTGYSNKIEDSDIIVNTDYMSVGQIVDKYYDVLKSVDVGKLESHIQKWARSGTEDGTFADYPIPRMGEVIEIGPEADNALMETLLGISTANGMPFRRYVDDHNNVRVLQVFWRSRRKILKVGYYDENGDRQYDLYPEDYQPNEAAGETAEELWVNEWWEGTKIGKDIYVNMRPRMVQYHRMNNPSANKPGIVGRAYNLNKSRAVSLVDRMKRYQYMYDYIFHRLNQAIANNHGKVIQPDFSMIPDGWKMDKWMAYLLEKKMALKDSFKEANKGYAQGTISGNLGHAGHDYMDLSQAQDIEVYISLLEFIKQEMGEIAGVSDQRLGQVDNRETVGGVERAVTQSNHVTEYWFFQHEQIKIDVLSTFLETAKVALKGENKKVQYILDDGSIELLSIEGDVFAEADYGVVVTNGYRSSEIEQSLKQLAHAAMQNDTISFGTLVDILVSNSISSIKHKIKKSEREAKEERAKEMESQERMVEKQIQAEQARFERELQSKEMMNMRDNETKITVKELDMMLNDPETPDRVKEMAQLELDRQKNRDDLLKFYADLSQRRVEHQDDVRLREKEIAVKKIAANKKPSSTSTSKK